ncbi:MAG TPA: Fe-S cluster assembly protein IscX [Fibrobacteria bacterium]|nr:Fe-S cluster assembly protein IscX [Fibrobacteria bacterium]
MKWTDVHAITAALETTHAEIDPRGIRFTDLHRWVLALPGFTDASERCNEKILESIQATWIEERD